MPVEQNRRSTLDLAAAFNAVDTVRCLIGDFKVDPCRLAKEVRVSKPAGLACF